MPELAPSDDKWNLLRTKRKVNKYNGTRFLSTAEVKKSQYPHRGKPVTFRILVCCSEYGTNERIMGRADRVLLST